MFALLICTTAVGASELFDRGAEALLYNKPREAATIFEEVVAEEPVNSRAYLYLALSYEQLDMYERAITTLQRAEDVPGVDRGAVRFNIGNNYLHLGDSERAHAAYSAAIEIDSRAVDPYLNRANVNVSLGRYEDAVDDYSSVLELAPEHPQREKIEQMITLLRGHIAEARRKAEEEQRQREEAEARRRALLNNVLDSIKTSSEETENLSAGSEEIDSYDDDEFDIAD